MGERTFDGQIAELGWVPGARPRNELLKAVLGQHDLCREGVRDFRFTLLGILTGAILGIAMKGYGSGAIIGDVTSLVTYIALCLSLLGAAVGALNARTMPRLMQFSSINLLTVMVVNLV